MVNPEKFGYLHLVYHFTVPLRTITQEENVEIIQITLYVFHLLFPH